MDMALAVAESRQDGYYGEEIGTVAEIGVKGAKWRPLGGDDAGFFL